MTVYSDQLLECLPGIRTSNLAYLGARTWYNFSKSKVIHSLLCEYHALLWSGSPSSRKLSEDSYFIIASRGTEIAGFFVGPPQKF